MTPRNKVEAAYRKINQYKDDPTSEDQQKEEYDNSNKEGTLGESENKLGKEKRPESDIFIKLKEYALKASIWIFLVVFTIIIGFIIALYREAGEINIKQDIINTKIDKTNDKLNDMDKEYNKYFIMILDKFKSK
jgi:hypothetical protein